MKCDTETQHEQLVLEKWCDLLDARLPQNLNLLKRRISGKLSKMKYACRKKIKRTGKPVMLQSMGLQRVGHNLVTAHQH